MSDLANANPLNRIGPARRAWLSANASVRIGLLLFVVLFLATVFAPWLATHDPASINPLNRLKPPSDEHWFGTDAVGRDLFSRTIYGGRVSLIVGFGVALFATVVGIAVGVLSGFVRVLDSVIMRVIDGMMSVPPILLAIALMALTRGSIYNVIFAISISEMPRLARLVRGTVLSLRKQPYVEAAVSAGAGTPRIILLHILPNTVAPVIVQATFIFASAMIIEAILSFIGAGVPPSTPSWGNIMADGRQLWLVKPYLIFFPAIFLSLMVLAVNLLGDGLRDILDPRTKRR